MNARAAKAAAGARLAVQGGARGLAIHHGGGGESVGDTSQSRESSVFVFPIGSMSSAGESEMMMMLKKKRASKTAAGVADSFSPPLTTAAGGGGGLCGWLI